MLIDNAIPRIGKGVISDTKVWVPTIDAPSAKPTKILPPKYMAGVSEMYATAIPDEETTMHVRNIARRPNQS